jgi:hypothetical protein
MPVQIDGRSKALMVAALLMAAPLAAQTAQPGQAQPSQAQQRQLLNSAQFVDAAFGIVRSVEGNQAAAMWDTASNVMKTATTKERFTTTMRARVIDSGPIAPVDWYAVTRTRVTQQTPNVPLGDYLTVGVLGTNKKGTTVRTTVTFHLDSDNNWRLAGYSVS